MKDLLPEWIKYYEAFQEMPLELSADIDRLLRFSPMTKDIAEVREYLADRFNTMQDHIEEMMAAIESGSKVWLMNDDERAGWNARVEAEKLERQLTDAS